MRLIYSNFDLSGVFKIKLVPVEKSEYFSSLNSIICKNKKREHLSNWTDYAAAALMLENLKKKKQESSLQTFNPETFVDKMGTLSKQVGLIFWVQMCQLLSSESPILLHSHK